jgi:hypothetical protein
MNRMLTNEDTKILSRLLRRHDWDYRAVMAEECQNIRLVNWWREGRPLADRHLVMSRGCGPLTTHAAACVGGSRYITDFE